MLRFAVRMFAAILACLMFAPVAEAKRTPVFWSYGGEHLHVVVDLPDTPEYEIEGKHFDIGVKYKALDIFFLPISHWSMTYVAMIEGDSSHYYELGEGKAEALAETANVSLPPVDQVDLGFWAEWGGKLVFGFLFVVGLIRMGRRGAT